MEMFSKKKNIIRPNIPLLVCKAGPFTYTLYIQSKHSARGTLCIDFIRSRNKADATKIVSIATVFLYFFLCASLFFFAWRRGGCSYIGWYVLYMVECNKGNGRQ